MNKFFARLLGRKAATTNTYQSYMLSQLGYDWWKGPTRSGVEVTTQSALYVPTVLAATRVICEGTAQLPRLIKKIEIKNGRKHSTPAYDHPAWHLLNKKPNTWMSAYEFIETLTLHAVLNGNGYAVKVRGLGDRVEELIPISSDMCFPEQLPDYTVQYRVADGKRIIGIIPQEDMLHLRGPGWFSFFGMNIIKKAAEAIGLSQTLQDQQSVLSGNGGRPSGILANKNKLSPEAVSQLREAWVERFGQGGTGGVAILDGEFDYKPLTMTGIDQQHLESREHQIAEVGRAMRVFPQMMMSGVDKNNSYGSAEQFFIAHVKHSLGPWKSRWEGAINRDLLDNSPDYESELDTTWLEMGTMNDRANYFAKALGSGGTRGWFTQNDVRAREGLNPEDGGDELPMPTNTSLHSPTGGNEPQ